MLLLRPVRVEDLEDLFELSNLYLFINLPPDREIIKSKIVNSIETFCNPSKKLEDNHYIFVLDDIENSRVVGCSMIHAQHGTEDEPHFYLSVGQENKFSKSINTGFIHGTLKLGYDTNGPSEIGGLILHPDYRGRAGKIGKQLSFVRFLYMGLYKNEFKEEVHSELMPPFDKDGKSPLWEAIGRRFLNMEYHDADVLSRKNKEFILSLFPSDVIYETLLPIEARNAVGKVGKDTLPVKKMLESIGFHYTHEVDPFDGGPHYRCKINDLKPVQDLKECEVNFVEKNSSMSYYLVAIDHTKENFKSSAFLARREGTKLLVSKEHENEFGNLKKKKLYNIQL